MKTLRLAPLFAILLMLGLTACPETSVPRNFGGKTLKLKTGDWQGTWRAAGDDDDLRFVVKDAATGQITVMINDDEKKTEEVVEIVMHETGVKEGGGLAFLLSFEKPGDEQGSLTLVTVPKKGVFHSWGLRNDAVEAAVKSGELKGTLKQVKEKNDEKPHNHAQLAADPANYAKLLDGKYWEWTSPTTYIRVPGK